MGRGYAYEITDDPATINSMDTDSIENHAEGLEIDYCSEMGDESRDKTRKKFCEMLKSKGATISETKGILSITGVTSSVKQNYFKDRFDKMKKLAAGITLEAFASDPYDTTLYTLSNTIHQQWSDIVYFNGIIYDLDTFIRNMQDDKTYYVGNIIHMH